MLGSLDKEWTKSQVLLTLEEISLNVMREIDNNDPLGNNFISRRDEIHEYLEQRKGNSTPALYMDIESDYEESSTYSSYLRPARSRPSCYNQLNNGKRKSLKNLRRHSIDNPMTIELQSSTTGVLSFEKQYVTATDSSNFIIVPTQELLLETVSAKWRMYNHQTALTRTERKAEVARMQNILWRQWHTHLVGTGVITKKKNSITRKPTDKKKLTVVCVSDTHALHSRIPQGGLPKGDVLIHAGDFSDTGRYLEIQKFLEWFKGLDYRYKIFIAGNHDLTVETEFYKKHWKRWHKLKPEPWEKCRNLLLEFKGVDGIYYLEDSEITIEGVKFYGSPWQPEFCSWAFNLPRGEPLREKWNLIPDDVDVLITHGPPYGILDKPEGSSNCVGCEELIQVIERIQPQYHVFGHIHEQHGMVKHGNTVFVNASTCTRHYRPHQRPLVFEVYPKTQAGTISHFHVRNPQCLMDEWNDNEGDYERFLETQEVGRKAEEAFNRGIREGYDRGKEVKIQEAFNRSFMHSASHAVAWHSLISTLTTLSLYLDSYCQISDQEYKSLKSELDSWKEKFESQYKNSFKKYSKGDLPAYLSESFSKCEDACSQNSESCCNIENCASEPASDHIVDQSELEEASRTTDRLLKICIEKVVKCINEHQ